ncbi:MAG: phosphate acyltransferase PlsX [Bacteroidota bacterium]
MRLGIDIMGGDYAPEQTTLGAIAAQKELPADVTLVLIGDKDQILAIMAREGASPDSFELIHTTEVIGMGEHPTKAMTQKQNSSISVGFGLLKAGKLDAFASAGNTGAMFVGSIMLIKPIEGVLRPAIASKIPRPDGSVGVILDVGANADCKPDFLVQFAMLGSIFLQNVFNISNPKVGLINIGEEAEKGNILSQTTYKLMSENPKINFIGNVEGRDMFNNKADVIVCDGFTGNIMLKEAESFYSLLVERNITDPYFESFNYENFGGTPILGVNSNVIVAHGISNAKAIKNMIFLTKEITEAKLSEKIKLAFN